MAAEPYSVHEVEPGIWQITDVLGDRAYLVLGNTAAVLVDTCAGYGDIGATVRELTSLPVTVLLTHSHYDHTGGSYFFDEAYIAQADDGQWEDERELALKAYPQLVKRGAFDPSAPFGPQDGALPSIRHVADGDVFDLGGITVEAQALPAHTPGSMGYLVRERRVLLSGDAVTPIMCLFFECSLGVDAHRATLSKMARLSFDRFYTGHHEVAFEQAELAGFDEAAAFAQEHPEAGIPWQHALLPEFVGTVYLPPCETSDADSIEFRAVIGPYVPRPHRAGRRRRRRARP